MRATESEEKVATVTGPSAEATWMTTSSPPSTERTWAVEVGRRSPYLLSPSPSLSVARTAASAVAIGIGLVEAGHLGPDAGAVGEDDLDREGLVAVVDPVDVVLQRGGVDGAGAQVVGDALGDVGGVLPGLLGRRLLEQQHQGHGEQHQHRRGDPDRQGQDPAPQAHRTPGSTSFTPTPRTLCR